MDIEALLLSLDIYRHFSAVLLGMPRIFTIIMIVPFLGSSVVTGQLRMVLALSIYIFIHPLVVEQLPEIENMSFVLTTQYFLLVFKEILLGLLLGLLSGLVFWAVQSAGFFIDNQRGASMAETSEIMSGEQTSLTGSLLIQSMTYLFFTTGAFLTFLGVLYTTYELWPITSTTPLMWKIRLPLYFAGKVGWMMTQMLLLAGPISVACLLTDISLGLVNRFASQLNVYVLAMPIKSGLSSFLLCFYFSMLLGYAPELFRELNHSIFLLENLFQP